MQNLYGDETKQNPVGLQGTKDFLCPPFLWLQGIGFIQLPWPSLSSKGQVQTDANQGKEGMQRQGRGSQETIVQSWGRVLVPPQGIHILISLSCFAETETPTRWEKLCAAHKHVDPRPGGTRGWWCQLPLTSPPTRQKNVHELITPLLNHSYKTPH